MVTFKPFSLKAMIFAAIALAQGLVSLPAYARGEGTQFIEPRHAIQRTENRAPAETTTEATENEGTAKKTANENTENGNASNTEGN